MSTTKFEDKRIAYYEVREYSALRRLLRGIFQTGFSGQLVQSNKN